MKTLSTLAEAVQASTTIAIDTMFKKMRADGIDVIGFGLGEPDFHTPEHIKQAGIRAIQDNRTKYTSTSGTLEVRKAVCTRLKADYGISYAPEQVVVSAGAKHILYAALKTLVNPGDEVILPAPYWVSYYELIKMVGGVPVVIDAEETAGFKMTEDQLRQAITAKTKVLILNNPSNPTGMMYQRAQLEKIAAVCVEQDLYVISDEIYGNLVFDRGEFVCFPTLGEEIQARTILVNGVSKSYAMTGWRIGYACADRKIIGVLTNYLSHSTSGTSSISQYAAVEALTGPQEQVLSMCQAFETRRNYLYERLCAIPGISGVRSEATFYMMMNLSELVGKTLYGVTIQNADDFARVFLEKGLVAVVPCTGFGAPNYVRWSFAASMEDLKEGADRLERFLQKA